MIEINRNSLPKTVKHNGKTFWRDVTYSAVIDKDQLVGREDNHVIVNVRGKISGKIKQWVFSLPRDERVHPESICRECNGCNPTWYADNDLFNLINGSPNGIICPSCFEKKAKALGISIIFKAQKI